MIPSSPEAAAEWVSCAECGVLVYRRRYLRLHSVCPECGHNGVLTPEERADLLFGRGHWSELFPDTPVLEDPLAFTDIRPYTERLRAARSRTGARDSVRVFRGPVAGIPVTTAVMDFRFLGGSLGVAAGEAVTFAAETARRDRTPFLLVTASGGARMQEGTLSLMQMAKTSNAMAELDEAGLLTVTLVTDPTYGGVAASFATLSDIVLAEPGARLGFAGPRVIEQTIGQRLPSGFQSAEALFDHGLLDRIVPRASLGRTLSALVTAGRATPEAESSDPVLSDPAVVPVRPVSAAVSAARELERPSTLEHLAFWDADFTELHGDRAGQDCPAVVGGIAHLPTGACVVVGHQKGRTPAELVRRRFGMSSPSGYRKAVRLMRLAAKLGLPLVTLIDTPGAHPGPEAEEQGQANAIAECLRTMGGLPVPVVAVVTGEGGSGGALALGVANEVLICENAVYSVISPEGCAAILWKSPHATEAAGEALRVDAASLLRSGVVDGVVPEPPGGAHKDPVVASLTVRDAVVAALGRTRAAPPEELVRGRRARFRRFGTAEPVDHQRRSAQ